MKILSSSPSFGFESASICSKEKKIQLFKARWIRNTWKVVGYFPGLGVIVGCERIIEAIASKKKWTVSNGNLHLAGRVTRSLFEIFGIGIVLLPIDSVMTLFRLYSKSNNSSDVNNSSNQNNIFEEVEFKIKPAQNARAQTIDDAKAEDPTLIYQAIDSTKAEDPTPIYPTINGTKAEKETPPLIDPVIINGTESEIDDFTYKLDKSDNFSLAENSHTWNGYLYENQHIINFLKTPDLHTTLKNCLGEFVNSKAAVLTVQDQTAPVVQCPTNEGLNKITEGYKQKYDINISVCMDIQLKNLLIELKQENDFPRAFIITNQYNLHVTPIIINKYANNLEVLILDVLGIANLHPYPMILRVCKQLNIIPFCTKEIRQADGYSCRTGAAVILRNALIDLPKDVSLASYFPDKNLKFFNPEEIYEVAIPPSWTYGDQIFFNNEKIMAQPIVRDSKSQNKQKNHFPKTIGGFRSQYQKKHAFKCTLNCRKEMFFKYISKEEFEKLIPEINLTKNCHIEIDEYFVIITWIINKKQNYYMLQKGHKFALKDGVVA